MRNGEFRQFFNRKFSMEKPPMLDVKGIFFGKLECKIFLKFFYFSVWDSIKNFPYIPTRFIKNKFVNKPRNIWSKEEKEKGNTI